MYPFHLLVLCFLFVPSLWAQSLTILKSEISSILRKQYLYKGSGIYGTRDTLITKDTLERFKDVLNDPAFPSFKRVRYLYFASEKNAWATLNRAEEVSLFIPVDTSTESFIPLISSRLSFIDFILEVKQILKKDYRFNGDVTSHLSVDNKKFEQGLKTLKTALETIESIPSFEIVNQVRFVNTNEKGVELFSTNIFPGVIRVEIPFDIGIDALITSLSQKLPPYFLRGKMGKLLKNTMGYKTSYNIHIADNIGDLELTEAFQGFMRALETTESILDFGMIRRITVTKGEDVRMVPDTQYKNYYNLNIPVTTPMESLIPILTKTFSIPKLQQEIRKILVDKYQYQSNRSVPYKSGIDDKTFISALEAFKEMLQINDFSVSFENVRSIFITDSDESWTHPYHDDSMALYIPAEVSVRNLPPIIESALLPLDELENRVYTQLQMHNYRGPPVTNYSHLNVRNHDYKTGLRNLWISLKTNQFIPDFGLIDQLWITKGKGRTWALPHNNGFILLLSSETARESLMPSIDIAIHGGTDQLLKKVEQTLRETFLFSGTLVRSWSANDEMFGKGLRAVLTSLERQSAFFNLNSVNRFVITGSDHSLWTWPQEDGLIDVYIPSGVNINDLILFLSQLTDIP